MRFHMGIHQSDWLNWLDVSTCVSYRRLADRRTLPWAESEWILDSGAYSEIDLFGKDAYAHTSPAKYARRVRRYGWEIGKLLWAGPQDWPSEAKAIAKTGLSVLEHRIRTVDNFIELHSLYDDLRIIPVLQGGEDPDDYRRCRDLYAARGVDLTTYPLVGVGGVCRRAATAPIVDLVRELASDGLKLHIFGAKSDAVAQIGDDAVSWDSGSWSYSGRYVPGCAPGHQKENNCVHYAIGYRERMIQRLQEAAELRVPAARGATPSDIRLDNPVSRVLQFL